MTDQKSPRPDDLARMIMLVYGPMQNKKSSYWCYVAIKPSEYQRFITLHKERRVNLMQFEEEGFGEIIVSGHGIRPPSEITHQVAQIYKMNVKDLFGEINPESVLSKKIEQMKKNEQI